MEPADVRVLALVRSYQIINGEADRASPPFRKTALRLRDLSEQGDWAACDAILDTFLEARPDGDEIRRAIQADDLGPLVEGEGGGPAEADDPEGQPELWPEPPAAEAYHGVLGEIVRKIEPNTEADPVAILGQLVVMFGNMLGRAPHFVVEADRHHGNEFLALVGLSSKGKKGSSYGRARRVAGLADPDWVAGNIVSGLSSDAGLVWALRDSTEKDEGVPDKRLLVHEGELANVFAVMRREGNALSAMLRNAWDGLTLRTLTTGRGKNGPPVVATDPHLSIIGHITRAELLATMNRTEAANGLVNRFIWLAVRRSRLLPRGGGRVDLDAEGRSLSDAVDFARRQAEVSLSDEAWDLWDAEYTRLTSPPPGLLGSALGRAESHVRRLAMLYALAGRSGTVEVSHLRAALALWDYAERSARFIFGESLGDPTAEKILAAIRKAPGITRTAINRDILQGNKPAGEMEDALAVLVEHGLAHRVREPGTHPVERWYPGRGPGR
jgi:hypothetical protein